MKISQREARRLRKQNNELLKIINEQRRGFAQEWPGGVHILSLNLCEAQFATVRTARALGHGVVLTPADNGSTVYLYALQLPELP